MADEQSALFLAEAMRNALRPALIAQAIDGTCLNCAEALDFARERFCDPECAADWQHRMSTLRKQTGA